MSEQGKLKILLLCKSYYGMANALQDHINSFTKYSRHTIYKYSVVKGNICELNVDAFDVIIIHFTLILCNADYISKSLREKLKNYRGLKVVFIQDEYRFVNKTIDAINDIRIDILFSCFPQKIIEDIYPAEKLPTVKKYTTLTGYLSEEYKRVKLKQWSSRKFDVGYRGRGVPYWLGALGQEKTDIGKKFLSDAKNIPLCCNIKYQEEERLYGKHWTEFLLNCKAVLGVESGASVIDFTGEIQTKVEKHLLESPDTSFETLREKYFKKVDNKIVLHVISPRVFESASLKILMVLYPGDYSGILKAWEHYIPLEKDHSNMADVVAVLSNEAKSKAIIDNAYQAIVLSNKYTYANFIKEFDEIIVKNFEPCKHASCQPDYTRIEFEKILRRQSLAQCLVDIKRTILSFVPQIIIGWLLFIKDRNKARPKL